jgi:threonine/homoserine/homoserine lactone efflux protein
MNSGNLYLFFIASLMLNLTPGNDMLYVASRSISQGIKAGIFSAIGIFIGCFVHILAAVFGLSYIIAQSELVFNIIKYAGAAYIIYLAIKTLTAKTANADLKNMEQVDAWTLMKQGIITNALNPKVAIFFISFLPQFITPSVGNVKMQLLTLGLWFDIQGSLILIIIAYLLGKTGNFIKNNPRLWFYQEKLTGVVLLFLGIKLAFTNQK